LVAAGALPAVGIAGGPRQTTRAGPAPLFLLFYQVEIRHCQPPLNAFESAQARSMAAEYHTIMAILWLLIS
jgi:hypothetical protein